MEDYLLLYCQEKLNFTPNDRWVGVQDICDSITYIEKETPIYNLDNEYLLTEYCIWVNNMHVATRLYLGDYRGGTEITFEPQAITVFEPYIRQIFEACINLQK